MQNRKGTARTQVVWSHLHCPLDASTYFFGPATAPSAKHCTKLGPVPGDVLVLDIRAAVGIEGS
jgi:hypothetical protein